LLKSRALLPQTSVEEDEEPLDDLAERLEEYRRFKEAAVVLAARLDDERQAFTHPQRPREQEYQPPLAPIDAAVLARLWRSISRNRPTALSAQEPLSPRVSVTERLTLLRQLLSRRQRVNWDEIVGGTLDELIATFLAVLELVRRSELIVHQDTCFGPIQLAPGRAPVALDRQALGSEPE
jgi:segregation and condensation protein A